MPACDRVMPTGPGTLAGLARHEAASCGLRPIADEQHRSASRSEAGSSLSIPPSSRAPVTITIHPGVLAHRWCARCVMLTIVGMVADPSWDVAPVANPDLPARRRKKLFDHAVLKDPIGLEEPAYQLRDRGLIVVPSTLDQLSRELLLRAQQAIAVALDAEAGAIASDGAVPESTLLRHEWEIAVALRDITDLRAEHGLNAAASVGPMTNAVLKSQESALAQAQEAIAARVAELERYAECVSAAGTAYRDWQDALRLSGLNDMYLDLVARTAADEYAVAEISGLAERAAAALTFEQAAQKVSLAAAALEFP